ETPRLQEMNFRGTPKRRQKFLQGFSFLFETPLFFWPRLMNTAAYTGKWGVFVCVFIAVERPLGRCVLSDMKIMYLTGNAYHR
ncbi:hypothetical protein K0M31_007389, partial [Melipona bicolor]